MNDPILMPPGVRFHERLATDWHRGYASGGFKRRMAMLESTLRRVVTPGACWLDLGCGAGTLTRLLAALGAQGEAVDGSPSMIEAARSLSTPQEQQAFRFEVIANVESPHWPAATFDGVLCSSVLEYLDRPADALAGMARILKPGGRLVLTAAHSRSAVRRLQKGVRALSKWTGRNAFGYLDVSRTTYDSPHLIQALQQAGFTLDRLTTFDPLVPPLLLRAIPGSLLVAVATRARP